MKEVIFNWLIAITEFVGSLFMRVLSGCVSFGLMWIFAYAFLRFFVCRNDNTEWESLYGDLRGGLHDLAKAFREAMPGVVQCAKDWANRKLGREDI